MSLFRIHTHSSSTWTSRMNSSTKTKREDNAKKNRFVFRMNVWVLSGCSFRFGVWVSEDVLRFRLNYFFLVDIHSVTLDSYRSEVNAKLRVFFSSRRSIAVVVIVVVILCSNRACQFIAEIIFFQFSLKKKTIINSVPGVVCDFHFFLKQFIDFNYLRQL